MMKLPKHPDRGPWWLVVAALAVLPLFSGCSSEFTFSTEYQAVLLDNGQVYFGKVSDVASPFLQLHDVHYVQRLVEAGTDKKEARNVLIKRGSELHGPDFMRVNSRHVVLIEPVSPDSRVAQLIREAKAPKAAKAPATAPPAVAPPAQAPPAAQAPAAPRAPVRR